MTRETFGTVTDPAIRSAVRSALGHQLGLDIPAALDGATVIEIAES